MENIKRALLLTLITSTSFASVDLSKLNEQLDQNVDFFKYQTETKEEKKLDKAVVKRETPTSQSDNSEQFNDLEKTYFDDVKTSASGIEKNKKIRTRE